MAGSHEEFATTSCFSELAFLGSIGMPFSRFFLQLKNNKKIKQQPVKMKFFSELAVRYCRVVGSYEDVPNSSLLECSTPLWRTVFDSRPRRQFWDLQFRMEMTLVKSLRSTYYLHFLYFHNLGFPALAGGPVWILFFQIKLVINI
jgi:hypothetical protein